MKKDTHINPKDPSTTRLARGTNCCGGSHQTIAGAILKSKEWEAWHHHATKNLLFDVDETQEVDAMSDAHWSAFVNFIQAQEGR